MFKLKKIKRYGREVEIEEIFLDKLAKTREQETDIGSIKLEVPLTRANFLLLIAVVALIFLFFICFAFYFQVFGYDNFSALAVQNSSIVSHFQAERGIIYDRNMEQLVKNEATFDLYLNTETLPSSTTATVVLKSLSGLIELAEPSPLLEAESWALPPIEKRILIKQNLSQMDLVLLETKKEQMPWLEVKKHIIRDYTANACLGHVLGYLGKISQTEYQNLKESYDFSDYIGRAGVEKTYEDILREKRGVIQTERDALGNELSQQIISPPSSGDHLILSLDLALQKKATQALSSALASIGGTKGVVLALNPQNGEVLAFVSMPCFDNNLFARGITTEELNQINENKSNPLLNRAVAGLYPTGSTIKPFMASAALEEGIITPNTTLYCPAVLCVENQFQKDQATCFPDNKFHGWTNVKRAIAESVNPFFYMMGGGYQSPGPNSKFYVPEMPKNFIGLGIIRVKEYLNLFGFGEKTGIDLPGEGEGRVPDPDWKQEYFKTALEQKWYLGDTYNLSIGQGYLLATPLQLAVGYTALANGGQLIKPHLAKAFLPATSTQAIDFTPEITRENFISTSTLQTVREGMRQTVTSPAGSAFSLNSLPTSTAAKTGTAQAYGKAEIYNNWISVFAPYENPSIELVVMIEEVPGLQGTAQKTAREILAWYFNAKKDISSEQVQQIIQETEVDVPLANPEQTPIESATTTQPITTTTENAQQ
ncbi:MAG: penicillin-binding protein 2 [Candidatus Pacebacteria bacterium]|nr:penicillin-binding protein 2 [Candidatus Paceibacterota bacterium]